MKEDIRDKYKDYVRTYINGALINEGHNDILTLGRNLIADRYRGRVSVSGLDTANAYLAVGYGSGTNTADMEALQAEATTGSIGRTLVGSTFRAVTGSTLYLTTWFYDSGGLGPIREYGLFTTGYDNDEVTIKTASATTDSGVLVARSVKDIVTHNAGDELKIEWRITL